MASNNRLLIIGILLAAGISACKTTVPKPARPMEQYDAAPLLEQSSNIHIPLRIGILEMERSINQQLQGVIYDDNDPDDGDNLALKVEKRDSISFGVSGRDLQYRLPMSIWFKYKAGITYLTGTAEIAIQFRTAFHILPDWSVQTDTQIESYEWLRKPKLQVGAIQIPLGFIGDVVLKNSQKTITSSIDRLAKEQFNLREQVGEAWKKMFEPVLISPEFKTWLLIDPRSVTMTPMQMTPAAITATIMVESRPRLRIGSRPEALSPTPLPSFRFAEAERRDFVIYLNAEVPYEEAERIAREQLLGETFSSGNRSVTVEDVELYGKGATMIVNTQLSGSFKGNVYFEGRPYFNLQRNSIDISDLNFTLETQNFLHKTAGWLLKSNLKRTIQQNLDFLLDTNLKDLEVELQKQLDHYPISQSIYLRGKLDQLQIQNAYMAPEAIRVHVGLRGNVEVFVEGLN